MMYPGSALLLFFTAIPYFVSASPIDLTRRNTTTTPTAPSTWTHPGVLVSGSQLDFVKQQISAKAEPWNTALNAMLDDDLVKGKTTPSPVPTVACGSASQNPSIGCAVERQDGLTAYANAVVFRVTGQQSYADTAIKFLNAWGRTLKTHASVESGSTNTPLQSGWSGAPWSRAAEIIAHSNAGWAASDIDTFKNMLKEAYVPFLVNGSTANGNWELVMVEALQGIAIFLEDTDLYNKALELYVARVPAYVYLATDGDLPVAAHGKGTGKDDIEKYWYGQSTFGEQANGFAQETCRDLGHTGLGLSAISHVAETTRIQGTDLYTTEIGDRLRYGLGFHSTYSGKYEAVPSWVCGGTLQKELGPMTEVGYNALAFRLNQSMTNTGKLTVAQRPAGTDKLFIGWETLTHADNKA